MSSPLHKDALHESGLRHTTGEALYVDDLPIPRGMLESVVVGSPHAHARLLSVDVSAAMQVPGVRAVVTAADVPGHLHIGPIAHDEEFIASSEVLCVGQVYALVVADTRAAAARASKLVKAEWEPLPAILTIEDAVAGGSFLTTPHKIRRGDPDGALAAAPLRVSATFTSGGQDHFYLETHVALVVPEEGGTLRV